MTLQPMTRVNYRLLILYNGQSRNADCQPQSTRTTRVLEYRRDQALWTSLSTSKTPIILATILTLPSYRVTMSCQSTWTKIRPLFVWRRLQSRLQLDSRRVTHTTWNGYVAGFTYTCCKIFEQTPYDTHATLHRRLVNLTEMVLQKEKFARRCCNGIDHGSWRYQKVGEFSMIGGHA
ncbi:hypothetical protein EJ03DRAFT_120572 [Teratosphaeria nubilosa]|uniref:Uncharacterized protein n=1 Tax=Teratosphaeria nubilosa TaxID=161662 RepID=A0A6G1L7U6_9PEZI|nr:hypothetical protein EJ03DRAFT_120572 [Teratosphaeria nubilosa]